MRGFAPKEEYDDLPPELQRELRLNANDRLIYEIIKDCGGSASIDRLLIESYRRTGKIFKRTTMVAMAYRAMKRGTPIQPDKKLKGFYNIINYENEND